MKIRKGKKKKKKILTEEQKQIRWMIRLKKIRLRNEVSDIHRITSYTANTGMVHFFIPGEKPIRIPLRFIIDKAIGKHGNVGKVRKKKKKLYRRNTEESWEG